MISTLDVTVGSLLFGFLFIFGFEKILIFEEPHDYFQDDDGASCVGPRKCIDHTEQAHKNHFGTTPSQKVQSPLEKNNHPEFDDSPLLDGDGIAKYQSLIGALQWTISLGRFDIATAVMSMSSF